METKEIITAITSRENKQVISSASYIISRSQMAEEVLPLIEYLPLIKEQTESLDLGGAIAPNQRFVDFAIKVIEFHRDSKDCPCCLYLDHGVVPYKEYVKGHVIVTKTTKTDEKWVDFYNVTCTNCQQNYKVIERESHFMWWKWTRL